MFIHFYTAKKFYVLGIDATVKLLFAFVSCELKHRLRRQPYPYNKTKKKSLSAVMLNTTLSTMQSTYFLFIIMNRIKMLQKYLFLQWLIDNTLYFVPSLEERTRTDSSD
jgi:hypothetical protein